MLCECALNFDQCKKFSETILLTNESLIMAFLHIYQKLMLLATFL